MLARLVIFSTNVKTSEHQDATVSCRFLLGRLIRVILINFLVIDVTNTMDRIRRIPVFL